MNKTLFIDCRMNEISKNTLKQYGYKLIESVKCDFFDNPVSTHPDMMLAKLDDKIFAYEAVHKLDTFFDVNYLKIELSKKLKYPKDIALNCAVVGKRLICNERYTDISLLEYAYGNGYDIINTNQGYSKCSTCIVTDNAIITEDDSIAECAEKRGIDTLKISKGFVKLDGYDYGFIGGASGLIKDNLIAFNGNIDLHPEGSTIRDFCNCHGVEVLNLNNLPLYDVGSIILL